MNSLIDGLTTIFSSILTDYGFFGVFLAFVTEQIIMPIPLVLLAMSAAFLLLDNLSSLDFINSLIFSISLPAALGVTVGSLLIYYGGFFLGKPFIDRWGKFLGFSWHEIEKVQKKFESSYTDEIVLFSLRAIPIFPTVSVSFFSGLVRLKMKSYLLFTFLGTFVRVLLLAVLGWQTKGLYHVYASFFNSLEVIGLIIILAVIVFVFVHRAKKKKLAKTKT